MKSMTKTANPSHTPRVRTTNGATAHRVLDAALPFADRPLIDPDKPYHAVPHWPARWVALPGATQPCFVAYRRRFRLAAPATPIIHVTADERYELYLDGAFIGRGPERSDLAHWSVDTYALSLAAGTHTLVARVASLGTLQPWAQISLRHGFLCASDPPELLATGVAPWDARVLAGYACTSLGAQLGTDIGSGAAFTIDAVREPRDWQAGAGNGWQPVEPSEHGNAGFQLYCLKPAHLLQAAELPPQRRERWPSFAVRQVAGPVTAASAEALLAGRDPLVVPAHATVTVLFDAGDYLCAYPEFLVSRGAGARIELKWCEALVDPVSHQKSDRNATAGLAFLGMGDTLLPDGSLRRRFDIPWWRSGRYLQLKINTAGQSLTLDDLAIMETRYPFALACAHQSDAPGLDTILERSRRTLYCCAHETFVDCPYYEQLQYIGDTRIQALCAFVHTADDRLTARALRLLASGARNPLNIPVSNYPAAAGQVIPPFALFFVAMLHDFARWRGRPDLLRPLLPTARATLDAFLAHLSPEGLLVSPPGWNYFDTAFPAGIPPGGAPGGISAAFNFLFAYALRLASELEADLGEPELAARQLRLAQTVATATDRAFYRPEDGLYADAHGAAAFSEHTQSLALLTGLLPVRHRRAVARQLCSHPKLIRTNAYFTHYLFEAYALLGRTDLLLARLQPWHDALAQGFKTFPEGWGGTRSDCHAWNGHPLYHYFASILGIRPATFGFKHVRIAPQPAHLRALSGTLPHPNGRIAVRMRQQNDRWQITITLPRNTCGTLVWRNRSVELVPGRQTCELVIASKRS